MVLKEPTNRSDSNQEERRKTAIFKVVWCLLFFRCYFSHLQPLLIQSRLWWEVVFGEKSVRILIMWHLEVVCSQTPCVSFDHLVVTFRLNCFVVIYLRWYLQIMSALLSHCLPAKWLKTVWQSESLVMLLSHDSGWQIKTSILFIIYLLHSK